MPHVTFIHGIANKPPVDDLVRIWRDTLADAIAPLPLGDLGVGGGGDNLMFWLVDNALSTGSISDQQASIIRASPAVR